MLDAYLIWHLRKAWAELTFTDTHRPTPTDPVAPAQRSTTAQHKASTHTLPDGQPARSFPALLAHLATLTRNHIHIAGTQGADFELLALPTPTQRRAFELLATPIPTHLPLTAAT